MEISSNISSVPHSERQQIFGKHQSDPDRSHGNYPFVRLSWLRDQREGKSDRPSRCHGNCLREEKAIVHLVVMETIAGPDPRRFRLPPTSSHGFDSNLSKRGRLVAMVTISRCQISRILWSSRQP